MQNPFKCLRRGNKEVSKQQAREIVQVFSPELCEKLRSFGEKKLHVTVIRPGKNNAEKDLTGEEIIKNFAHEFELKAFIQHNCLLVQASNAQHAIILAGLENRLHDGTLVNLLTLQIRE